MILPHPPMLKMFKQERIVAERQLYPYQFRVGDELHSTIDIIEERLRNRKINFAGSVGQPSEALRSVSPTETFLTRSFRSWHRDTGFYSLDSSANTFCSILCPLSRLSTRNRSSTKCALSLACPIGKLTALAPNSFSNHRTPGIEPPYTKLDFCGSTKKGTVLPGYRWVGCPTRLRRPVPTL